MDLQWIETEKSLELFQLNLAVERRLKIAEKKAEENIREQEIYELRQHCESNKIKTENKLLEMQIKAEQQRFYELQKMEAKLSAARKQLINFKLKNNVKNHRTFAHALSISKPKKIETPNANTIVQQRLKHSVNSTKIEDIKSQAKDKFELNVAVEKQRQIAFQNISQHNKERFNETYKERIYKEEIKKIEAEKKGNQIKSNKKLTAMRIKKAELERKKKEEEEAKQAEALLDGAISIFKLCKTFTPMGFLTTVGLNVVAEVVDNILP
ncbi:unnamed protein product [Diamesa hyperborea]